MGAKAPVSPKKTVKSAFSSPLRAFSFFARAWPSLSCRSRADLRMAGGISLPEAGLAKSLQGGEGAGHAVVPL